LKLKKLKIRHGHFVSCFHWLVTYEVVFIRLHCVPKKEATKLLAIILSNLNRCSKFFHCWKEEEISNKIT